MTKIKTKKIPNQNVLNSTGYTLIKCDGFYKITFFIENSKNSTQVTINNIPINSGGTAETKIVTFKCEDNEIFETDFNVFVANNNSVYVAMYYK